jgi:outer membrane protein
MEIPVFTGFNTPNTLAQHRWELKSSIETLEKMRNDLALQIARAYYQILLGREILIVAREQLSLSRELETLTQILIEHSKVPESQLFEVQSQVASDELQAVSRENALLLSLVELENLMEKHHSENFDIAPLSEDTLLPAIIPFPDDIFLVAEKIMPEIKVANYTVESRKREIKAIQSGYYPSLSLQGEINTGYYYAGKTENLSFSEQTKNNLQKAVYITLRIPLFDRLQTRNSVRKARKDLLNSNINADKTLKNLYLDIQKTYINALSAQKKYSSGYKAVTSAREALRYANEKYLAGRATIYEYNKAKVKLANALSEHLQARYEFLLQMYLLDFYNGNQIKQHIYR